VSKSCQGYLQRSGANSDLFDPDWSVELQTAMIEDSMERDVDGIVLFAVDSAAMAPAVDKAGEAGYPVFCFDVEVYSDYVVHRTTYNNPEKGAMGAQALIEAAEALDKELMVYQCVSLMTVESCVDRQAGFEAELAGNPLITLVPSPNFMTMEEITNGITDAFATHPEYDAVYINCGDADCAKVGLAASDRRLPIGDPDHVVLVVQDGFPAGLDGLREGWVDVCINNSPWCIGDTVAKAVLTNVCLGQSVPELVELPLALITKDNADVSDYGGPMRWGDMIRENEDATHWPILSTYEVLGVGVPTPSYK